MFKEEVAILSCTVLTAPNVLYGLLIKLLITDYSKCTVWFTYEAVSTDYTKCTVGFTYDTVEY